MRRMVEIVVENVVRAGEDMPWRLPFSIDSGHVDVGVGAVLATVSELLTAGVECAAADGVAYPRVVVKVGLVR